MKIIKLQAENIKKLIAVEIQPDGSVVKITGKNGAGKTSVLDAIQWALEGMGNVAKKPIREGQEKGSITIDLGDMTVERTFKQSDGKFSSQLTVKNKEGARFPSPQKMLDDLIGRLSFDPLEFMRLKSKEQFNALRELVGLDFSEIDNNRQLKFNLRTDINRDLKNAIANRDAITYNIAGAQVEVSQTDIVEKIRDGHQVNNEINFAKSDIEKQKQNILEYQEQIKQLNELIGKAQAVIEEKQPTADKEPVNVVELQKQLETIEGDNKNARAYQQFKDLDAKVSELQEKSEKLTKEINGFDIQKQEAIKAADMPLPGLSFDEDVVLYNGIPIDQASASEQLRVSMAMAMKMNPKLRVIRITDGSLLDDDSMKEIEKLAADNDYQVWIELVNASGDVGVLIEDGQVKPAK